MTEAKKLFIIVPMNGKILLVVGAHPDDPEFGCGATVAKYIKQGAIAYYVISTDGNRGSRQHSIENKDLVKERRQEQQNAAKIIGIKETYFLDHEDGNLTADIKLKEEIAKIIRKIKPDIVFTHDPSWFYAFRADGAFINHNDHRKTGEATLDAVYPLARDRASFPEHLEQGLTPYTVKEVLLFNSGNPNDPNYFEDVEDTIDIKTQAFMEHKSQVDDPVKIKNWIEKISTDLGKKAGYKYAEGFTRLLLR